MTTNTKKMIATMLTLAMVLTIAPTVVQAASEPYCTILVQGNEGNLYYYEQSNGSFVISFSRNLWWSHSTHELKFSNSNESEPLTKNLLEKSDPAYAEAGKYIVWQEPNNVLMVFEYGSKNAAKKFENVIFFSVNAENFVSKVALTDGSEKSFSDFLAAPTTTPAATPAQTVTPSATPVATATPGATASPSPTTTPSVTPVATVTPASTTTPAVSGLSVDISIDSAGQTNYKISDGNKVIVSGNDVYWNSYKISELCTSSVQFVGIDDKGRVCLYEDATASYYRFDPANIFSPEKIKLAAGATLVKAINNDRNIMTAIETSVGTFKTEQLAVDSTWYPGQTYEINKSGYCQYYLADTNESYILTLKGTTLYLGVKELKDVTITRNDNSFGFKGNTIRYQQGSIAYWAPINNPQDKHIWKQNVAKLIYSDKDGTVTGVKKLTTKVDWVKNGKTLKSATLYQSGAKYKGVKITKKGASVSLDGKVIAKLSKKQKKAKVKYTSVGFTEDGYIYVATNKAKYRALLSAPKSLKKWNISKVTYDSLGFCHKG